MQRYKYVTYRGLVQVTVTRHRHQFSLCSLNEHTLPVFSFFSISCFHSFLSQSHRHAANIATVRILFLSVPHRQSLWQPDLCLYLISVNRDCTWYVIRNSTHNKDLRQLIFLLFFYDFDLLIIHFKFSLPSKMAIPLTYPSIFSHRACFLFNELRHWPVYALTFRLQLKGKKVPKGLLSLRVSIWSLRGRRVKLRAVVVARVYMDWHVFKYFFQMS